MAAAVAAAKGGLPSSRLRSSPPAATPTPRRQQQQQLQQQQLQQQQQQQRRQPPLQIPPLQRPSPLGRRSRGLTAAPGRRPVPAAEAAPTRNPLPTTTSSCRSLLMKRCACVPAAVRHSPQAPRSCCGARGSPASARVVRGFREAPCPMHSSQILVVDAGVAPALPHNSRSQDNDDDLFAEDARRPWYRCAP